MRKVIFSKRATNRLDKLLKYLESHWSLTVKNNFIIKMDKAIKQIRIFPESSQKSETEKGLHQFIVTKQTSIFYKFDSKTIQIITIFDNRMDPNKLKEEFK